MGIGVRALLIVQVTRAARLVALMLWPAILVACSGDEQDHSTAPASPVSQTRQALSPDANCTHRVFGGGEYWFCNNDRSWASARSRCQAQGMDLVRIDSAAENDFVRSNIDGDWWLGANDQATEGTWRWAIGGNQFWSGAANGSAVGGLFTRWDGGQPNNLGNEDCAQMRSDGDWSDDACSDSEEYVCEFAVDSCPNDPNKSVPGECGCGTPDTDSDGDGTPNCHDECPNDTNKIVPGDCGCSDAPKPAGTACNDGLCAANNQCNGSGRCGTPSACAPEPGCTLATFESQPYWFCGQERSFATARQRCLAVGMDLAAIETAEEDAFITGIIDEHVWIGSTDAQTQGDWKWLGTDKLFWTGGTGGGPFGGAYTNWEENDPDFGINGDCAAKDPPAGAGKWETFSCTQTKAYVCERMLDVHPTLKCIRRHKGTHAQALFGYDNQSSVALVIPLGPKNHLTPDPGVAPPREFEPGVHDRVFFVPFDLTGTMTWHLAGEQAVANSSSPLCQLGDVPPEEEPKPAPLTRPIERPTVPFASIADDLAPEVPTQIHLPAGIYGPEFGPESGNTTNEEAGPATFTFTVNSLNFDDSEGLCGTVDPFVNHLLIDGQDKGETRTGSVLISRDRRTVHVTVDVDDADSFACLGDEDLRNYPLDVDLYTGASNTCIDGGRMCFSATAIAAPEVCLDWKVQYSDTGPWNGIGSEDFLADPAVLLVPASFARYRLKMENTPSGVMFDRGGVLDARGCVPGPKLPIREHWQLGTDLKVTTSLISQHCLDPDDTDCPRNGTAFTGANVTVRRQGQTGPDEICATFIENPASVTEPNCVAFPMSSTALPPSPIRPIFAENDSITRASGVISHLFKREQETNGGLGIKVAMIDRRLEDDGHLAVVVDQFCNINDPCAPPGTTPNILATSCFCTPTGPTDPNCPTENSLLLEPDGVIPAVTRFKNVIAHEFGHYIQANGYGAQSKFYGCGSGSSTEVACRCDHVLPDEQLHCLQSLEEPNAAQAEGFGYYYSAKAFNEDLQPDCTFAYGKAVANTSCMPGAKSCAADPATGLFVSQPPVPINCRIAQIWRNTHCVDQNSSPDLLASGVEWDWVEFLYAINNLTTATERWSMVDIFDVYRSACGGLGGAPASCSGVQVSWAGNVTHASLVDGAQELVNDGVKTTQARDAFRARGDDFGVSTLP